MNEGKNSIEKFCDDTIERVARLEDIIEDLQDRMDHAADLIRSYGSYSEILSEALCYLEKGEVV